LGRVVQQVRDQMLDRCQHIPVNHVLRVAALQALHRIAQQAIERPFDVLRVHAGMEARFRRVPPRGEGKPDVLEAAEPGFECGLVGVVVLLPAARVVHCEGPEDLPEGINQIDDPETRGCSRAAFLRQGRAERVGPAKRLAPRLLTESADMI
jgi:hypothetical protein